MFSKELNAALSSADLPVRLTGDYHMPHDVQPLEFFLLREEQRKGKILFDAPKLRLAEDLTVERLGKPSPLLLERTSYFASVCTNEAADKEVRLRASRQVQFRGIDLCSSAGVLRDLCQSDCSNHIGVSTLAITADGCLIATIQAAGSAQHARRIAPSGSGSADLADFTKGDTLQRLVVRAMERELREECGLPRELPGLTTFLIGYARLVDRGGKPEFFGLTFLPVMAREMKVRRAEALFVADHVDHRINRGALLEDIARLREESTGEFTPAMHIALGFLADAIAAGNGNLEPLLARRSV